MALRIIDDWSPSSWQNKSVKQQPTYPDQEHLERVVAELSRLPPLVSSLEVEAVKKEIAAAGRGEAFVLQGGDCAESFDDCEMDAIAAKVKILLQMSLVLMHGTKKPVVRIGRIAGQYAKPRSANEERRGDVTLPSYRGDIVNRSGFTTEDRTPNPDYLLRGYERAALTLNFIRSLTSGGVADLHHPEYWDLSFARHSKHAAEYRRIVESIRESIQFLDTVHGARLSEMSRVNFYTSHEGLSLHYEQAQTRRVPLLPGWYNLSTHLPWIGMRTAHTNGAHVEFFRGVRNPIGIKVGPTMTESWLVDILDRLHPFDEPGRVMLIHRMGASQIAARLPPLINAVRRTGKRVTWCADPMHGNTETTADGIKTRRFENILSEIEQAFEIHEEMGTILGGVHFECTGENVTECVGGARGLSEEDLKRAYRSRVDPRLNHEQSLEMAMRVAQYVRNMDERLRRRRQRA